MTIRAQGDHLYRVVWTALSEVLDVVDLEDRVTVIGQVVDVAGAARVLASARAAQ